VGDVVTEPHFEEWAVADMPRLRRLAHLLMGNPEDAADLLQETLIRVGLAWKRIDRDPGGYASRTMARLAWRQWRRRSREHADRLAAVATRDSHTEPGFARSEARMFLRDALLELGVRQRTVVVLRFYSDLTAREIADTLGCSTGTVKSQLSRALAKLRSRLDTEDTSPSSDGRR
jgi:RNA polymerase sigma-70 factor (sigma-E family)